MGRAARKRLFDARETIARYLSVKPEEIVFTSGCTEALHLLISGLGMGRRIVTSPLEHSSLYECVKERAHFLKVDVRGAPIIEGLEQGDLVMLSGANGETGVMCDIEQAALECQRVGADLVIDATQMLRKVPLKVPPGVTAMTFSAHKMGGPKGVGCLFLRKGTKLRSLNGGGHQEFGLRAGTENLMGIVAMAAALEDDFVDLTPLRDRFEAGLKEALDGVHVNGSGPRLPNTSNIAFEGISAEELLIHLDQAGVAASHGSACSARALEPSRVLLAMGLPRERVLSSVRFSFGQTTTIDEIDEGIRRIAACVRELSEYGLSSPR